MVCTITDHFTNNIQANKKESAYHTICRYALSFLFV